MDCLPSGAPFSSSSIAGELSLPGEGNDQASALEDGLMVHFVRPSGRERWWVDGVMDPWGRRIKV